MEKNTETPVAGVNVPVGASTVAGGGVSLVAFVGAAIAFASGDHGAPTVELLGTGLVSLALVLGGRYAQAAFAVLAQALANSQGVER